MPKRPFGKSEIGFKGTLAVPLYASFHEFVDEYTTPTKLHLENLMLEVAVATSADDPSDLAHTFFHIATGLSQAGTKERKVVSVKCNPKGLLTILYICVVNPLQMIGFVIAILYLDGILGNRRKK